MTLYEHAQKIWDKHSTVLEMATITHMAFHLLPDVCKFPLYEQAYAELRKEVEEGKERGGLMANALARITASLFVGTTGGYTFSEIADEAIEKVREASRLRAVVMDKDRKIDEIRAELAELRARDNQPVAPKYEWRGDTLFRGSEEVGRVILTHKSPVYVWRWVVSFACRSLIDGQSKGSLPLAKAAVEAVVRAHYGDEA